MSDYGLSGHWPSGLTNCNSPRLKYPGSFQCSTRNTAALAIRTVQSRVEKGRVKRRGKGRDGSEQREGKMER